MKIKFCVCIKRFVSLILLIFISFFFSFSLNTGLAQEKVLESLEKSIASLVEKTKPSLVTIQGEKEDVLNQLYYFKTGKKDRTVSATFVGSGLVYRPDGYILTTTSVAGGTDIFKVTLADGKKVKGSLVGTDEQYNLAVLKIERIGLTPARMGNSDEVKVGSWVTVVGNSYGVPNAVSFGVVNGIREDGLIQMSANVSPGNSGGPVLNTKGEVIGIVSVKVSEPSYIEAVRMVQVRMHQEKGKKEQISMVIPPRLIELPSGVSLAIPINEAKKIADFIIEHGTIHRGYLGVYPLEIDEKIKREYGVSDGVFIEEVVQGSPADEAGMENNDIVLVYNKQKVASMRQFRKLILDTSPSQEVEIKILREGKKRTLIVKIGKAEPLYGVYSPQYRFQAPPREVVIPEFEIPEIKVFNEKAQRKSLEQILEQMREFQEQMQGFREEKKSLEIDKQELNILKMELEKLKEELEEIKKAKNL